MKKHRQVLIIESNTATLELIRDTLAPSYHILTARDALEGVDILMTERLDLLIVDSLLPVLSGAELIRILRAYPLFSQIPIIAFPSYSEKLYPFDPAHVQAILPKPFSIDALARTVADTLERSNGHGGSSPALEAPQPVA